ncbi:protein Opi10p [[Candida] railenensis]|uniref:Protein Opi10p n=1 Tax=[Candida] railenensis TaxID=45579 RepID=A0A9P0W0L1_9ASCO|nr:protein Opi10p [[Candida] railenensis]
MFGVICSGRPIQLANQVETTKYVINITNASNISHIALFLLPQTEFTDPNFTGLVYIQLPNSPDFKLLGGINPNKPSAIYKLNNNNASAKTGDQIDDVEMNIDNANINGAGGADLNSVINIGISIEPTPQAELLIQQEKAKQQQLSAGNSSALVPTPKPSSTKFQPSDVAVLANRIVTHAYNYLGSFIDSQGKVPMKAFDTWWDKFKTKLQNNPGFLDEL